MADLARWSDLLLAVRATAHSGTTLDPFLRHIMLVTKVTRAVLAQFIRNMLGDEAMKSVLTTGEQLIQEGLLRGKALGKAEGLLDGQRGILLRQLTARFGPLPQATIARIEDAQAVELGLWAERILTADNLGSVFA